MEQQELIKEQQHLNEVLDEIDSQIIKTQKQINDLEKEMDELIHHFSDHYYFLDDEETVTAGDEMDDAERVINEIKKQHYRLKKQRLSPYFGKIDFKRNGKTDSLYIGTFSLTNGTNIPLVCDWRAPVSTMYYDYELGEASYVSPVGEIRGEITKKRQFKIKDSVMELCFDSNLTIQDEILQRELSNNSSQKMKNIVSTIQKEQNLIIRDDRYAMFVQGVAGSGKTSIALHRIAYLLYKFRDKYKSNDILILSPNSIFSDYISTVLPSLGEENVLRTSFYSIARNELISLVPHLQTREDSLNELAENPDRLNQVAYKNSFEFFESLKTYLKTYVNLSFNARDLTFGDVKITKEELEDLYNKKYIQKTPAVRVDWIADYIIEKLDMKQHNEDLYQRIKKVLYPMFIKNNLLEIYADFLDKIGMQFSFTSNKLVRYEDIAPILYIKNYVVGTKKLVIKHLVIDEMQDYSPVHLELFNEMFNCSKTVLGDISQCIEKIIDLNDLNKYANLIEANEILMLNKSYRSTNEITNFASNIKNLNVLSVERYGKEVEVNKFNCIEKEAEYIESIIKEKTNYNTIAIICKTKKQAQEYYAYLGNIDNLQLLTEDGAMTSNIMIMPASLSKGLEFDVVIVPNISSENYNNFLDKNLLYVNTTRALHELYLTTHNDVTKFIKNQK